MKNRTSVLLLSVFMLFLGFLMGFFLGRNHVRESVVISVPPQMLEAPALPTESQNPISFPIDINTANKETLLALPEIGETLAFRILSYRRERGPFNSIYDLLKVDGMTDSILDKIKELIYIGG